MGRRDLPLIVLTALCLVLVGRGCARDSAYARDIAYADSIKDVALDSLASARERADSLFAEAEISDTVLVTVTDTVEAEVAESDRRSAVADSSFASKIDSLRYRLVEVHADTLGTRLLNEIVVDHTEVASAERASRYAVEYRLRAVLNNAAVWRAAAHGERHRAESAEQALAAAEAALTVRDDALAAKDRRAWYERGAAVAVVAIMVLK